MPIQIPELNTGGIASDVPNVLAKIASMRHMKATEEHMGLQNQNLQSEIAVREANAPSLRDERETQNTLRKAETLRQMQMVENEKVTAAKNLMDNYTQGLGIVKPEEWPAFRNYYSKASNRMLDSIMPAEDAFLKPPDINGKQVVDTDAFQKHKDYVLDSHDAFKSGAKVENKIVYTPDGKTMSIPVRQGKTVDPEAATGIKGATFEKPQSESEKWKSEDQYMQFATKAKANGGLGLTPDVAAERWLKVKAKYTKEGKIVVPEKEDKVLVPVQQDDGSIVYMKRSEAAGKKVGAKPKAANEALDRLEKMAGGTVDTNTGKTVPKAIPVKSVDEERALATAEIAKRPNAAAAIKQAFKTRTGQDF